MAERETGPAAQAATHAEPRLSPLQADYLDCLRGVSAQIVLITHALAIPFGDSTLTSALGSLGVCVFFLLSGFLITYSVLTKSADRTYGLSDFLSDRFFRIYAAYLPALVFVAWADSYLVQDDAFRHPERVGVVQFFGNLFMLQDFPVFRILEKLGTDERWLIAPYGSAGPFWTISIEFWIYVAFGLLYFGFLAPVRIAIGRAPLVVLALLIAAIEPLYHLAGGFGECLTLLWLTGAGAAYLFLKSVAVSRALDPEAPCRARWFGACAMLFVGLIGVRGFTSGLHWYDFQTGLFTAIVLFSLLATLAACPRAHLPGYRVWRRIADYSYSLYLTHSTVITAVVILFGASLNGPLMFGLALLGANAVALVFWYVFERHYRAQSRWFRAWLKRRYPLPAPARA